MGLFPELGMLAHAFWKLEQVNQVDFGVDLL